MSSSLIYEQMTKVMSEVDAIGKDATNKQQGFKYRGIDQVYNSLNPLLAKHKIFTMPKVLNSEREERKSNNGGALLYSRVTMEYTFFTTDGSSVSCSVIGEGMDSGDKATNKAMAIAHKYALLQTFCIPTEDMIDPDSEVHEIKPKPLPQKTQEQLNKDKFVKLLGRVMAHFKCDQKHAQDLLSSCEVKTIESVESSLSDFGGLIALMENKIKGEA